MDITSVMFLINAKKAKLEEKFKKDERIDEFEIEDLDKNDQRKDVMIILNTPINHKYLTEMLESVVDGVEEKAIKVE